MGYYGVSYPFRIGTKGGIMMSGTSEYSCPHIEESIEQILLTQVKERIMNRSFGSNLSTSIFEPNDLSLQSLIKYEIVQALKEYEPRIEVTEEDISIEEIISEITKERNIVATINYKVIDYANTSFSKKVEVI